MVRRQRQLLRKYQRQRLAQRSDRRKYWTISRTKGVTLNFGKLRANKSDSHREDLEAGLGSRVTPSIRLHSTNIDRHIYGHCMLRNGLFHDNYNFLKSKLAIDFRKVAVLPNVPRWEKSRKVITNEELGVVDEYTANKYVAQYILQFYLACPSPRAHKFMEESMPFSSNIGRLIWTGEYCPRSKLLILEVAEGNMIYTRFLELIRGTMKRNDAIRRLKYRFSFHLGRDDQLAEYFTNQMRFLQ